MNCPWLFLHATFQCEPTETNSSSSFSRTGRPLASVFSTCRNSIRKLQREITILCRVQISDSRRRAIHPGSPRAIFSLRGRKLENCLVFIIFCDWSRARITPVNLLLYYLRIRLIQNKTDGQIGPPSVLSELLLYADINDESFQCFPFFFPARILQPAGLREARGF